jgi:hypothetical protein
MGKTQEHEKIDRSTCFRATLMSELGGIAGRAGEAGPDGENTIQRLTLAARAVLVLS